MKEKQEKRPWISVITVCYNAAPAIEQTMRSVWEQTYPFVEYIVIDGGSTDGTKEKIARSESLFTERNYRFRFVSEPDRGIYDAMNKGIRLAEGEWINFMNAGDSFYDRQVLERVFERPVSPSCSILYGDTVLRLAFGEVEMAPKPLDYLQKKMAFCHQSAFVRTGEMRRRPFDTRYRLAADYDFFYACYLQKQGFEYLGFPVAVFESEEGTSSSNRLEVNREYARVKGIDATLSWRLKYAGKWMSVGLKKLFYACLPEASVKKLRKKNYERLKRRRLK